MTSTIDPDAGDRLSIVVDANATIVDYYAHEIEETIVIVLEGEISRTHGGYLHEIDIKDLDQMNINWQAPTPEQLVTLCLDERVGIYA